MKNKLIFLLLFLWISAAFGQNVALFAYEDSIIRMHQQVLETENDSAKLLVNTRFGALITRAATQENSINYPFDSLKSISILTASDKSFRIFNWELGLSDGNINYYGIIQTLNRKTNQYIISQLIDQSNKLKKAETMVLEPGNWYGAHYYKLIETTYKKKVVYTLLGANWSNALVRKKIIEPLQIGNDAKAKFGAAIFQTKTNGLKRIVFNYSSEVSMSLRFDDNRKQILYDHLVPRSPELKGQYEFYGPDMSIDGLHFKKGKWQLLEDVDARNEKRK
ncbi:MAG: hypothetical protein IPP32_09705 [Bacteroidetes bacterium]|nr:hypothetical protein [Bacteroidota bacterium]